MSPRSTCGGSLRTSSRAERNRSIRPGTSGHRQASSHRTASSSSRSTGATSSPTRPRRSAGRGRAGRGGRRHRRGRPPHSAPDEAGSPRSTRLPGAESSTAYRSTPSSSPALAPSSTSATGRSGRSAVARRETHRDVDGAVDLVRLRAVGGDAFDELVAVLHDCSPDCPARDHPTRPHPVPRHSDTTVPQANPGSAARARARRRATARDAPDRGGRRAAARPPRRLGPAHDTGPHRAGGRHTRRRTRRSVSGSGRAGRGRPRGSRRSSAFEQHDDLVVRRLGEHVEEAGPARHVGRQEGEVAREAARRCSSSR